MYTLLLYLLLTFLIIIFNRYLMKKLCIINMQMKNGFSRKSVKVLLMIFTAIIYITLTSFVFFKHDSMNCVFFLISTFIISTYFYFLVTYLVTDLLSYPIRKKAPDYTLAELSGIPYLRGVLIGVFALCMTTYGMWNAACISTSKYNFSIPKSADYSSLKIAVISDVSTGASVRNGNIEKITERVAKYEPDIVVLLGRMTAVKGNEKLFRYFIDGIRNINAPLGTYFTGDRSSFAPHSGKAYIRMQEASFVTELNERCILKDGIYIAGVRDKDSVKLEDTIFGVAPWRPLILFSDKPINIDRLAENHITLAVAPIRDSGIAYPFSLITSLFTDQEETVLISSDNSSVEILSQGCGTKDMPIRIRGKNEIVFINLKFTGDETSIEEETL